MGSSFKAKGAEKMLRYFSGVWVEILTKSRCLFSGSVGILLETALKNVLASPWLLGHHQGLIPVPYNNKFPTPTSHRAILRLLPFCHSDRPPLLPPQTPRRQRRGPKNGSRHCQTTTQFCRAIPSSFCNIRSYEATAPQPSTQRKDNVIPLQKQHRPVPYTVPQCGRGGG